MSHHAQVVFLMGSDDPYSGLCSCGWRGEGRPLREAAEADAEAHEEQSQEASALFDLAVDFSRLEAGRIATEKREHREQGKREGREALAAAVISELDAYWMAPGRASADDLDARIRECIGDARNPLDRAWEVINALGGNDTQEALGGDEPARCGYGAALEDALRIIEELGGMDPVRRKAVKP